jgi:hypothetical protein
VGGGEGGGGLGGAGDGGGDAGDALTGGGSGGDGGTHPSYRDGTSTDDALDAVSRLEGILGLPRNACAALLSRSGGDVSTAVNHHFQVHDVGAAPIAGGSGLADIAVARYVIRSILIRQTAGSR